MLLGRAALRVLRRRRHLHRVRYLALRHVRPVEELGLISDQLILERLLLLRHLSALSVVLAENILN